jgi:ribosomal protein L29
MPAKGRTHFLALPDITRPAGASAHGARLFATPASSGSNKKGIMPFQATVVQKKLEEAGFEPKLAFGLTAVLERDVVAEAENRFVTREYLDARLAELKAELKTEISELRTELKTEISELRAELRTEIAALRTEIAGVRTEIAGVRTEMSGLRAELNKWMAGMVGGPTLVIILTLLRVVK